MHTFAYVHGFYSQPKIFTRISEAVNFDAGKHLKSILMMKTLQKSLEVFLHLKFGCSSTLKCDDFGPAESMY